MSSSALPDFQRFRPLRSNAEVRLQNAETRLDGSEFVYPMFVINGENRREQVPSMPGIARLSVDEAMREVERASSAGINRFLFFGIPDEKDATGTKAWSPDEAVQRSVAELRRHFPDAVAITDVCMCEYTDHGHCGKLTDNGEVDNDATLPLLASAAVSHADAGAQVVAPSAMMDGQVAAIRVALDDAGYQDVKILGYSAKYASAFYGPFRDAADSTPTFGDRRSYQMATSQRGEAMNEIEADIAEGADYIMVKPALAYLDVIACAKGQFPDRPLYAYNVSGEFSMIHAAAANEWIDLKNTVLEVLLSIKRAGADNIISYFSIDAAKWINGDSR